jgi:hypothetical protein
VEIEVRKKIRSEISSKQTILIGKWIQNSQNDGKKAFERLNLRFKWNSGL